MKKRWNCCRKHRKASAATGAGPGSKAARSGGGNTLAIAGRESSAHAADAAASSTGGRQAWSPATTCGSRRAAAT